MILLDTGTNRLVAKPGLDPSGLVGDLKSDGSTITALKHARAAGAAPTGSDNFAAGWAVGSVWIYSGAIYNCTGDGTWVQVYPAPSWGSVSGYQVASGNNSGLITSSSAFTWDGSSLIYTGTNAAQFRGSGGSGTTCLGNGATCSAANGTAVGRLATCGSSGGVALGDSANCGTGAYNLAIGPNGTNSGSYSTRIGYGGAVSGNSVGIGYSPTVSASNAVGIGYNVIIGPGHTASIGLGTAATTTAANQMVVGGSSGPITSVFCGNGVTGASPSSVTINATGGTGTNINGGTLTLAGGRGTGTGTSTLRLQTSTAGSSGSTLQTLATVLEVSGGNAIGLFGVTPVTRSTGWSVTNSSTRKTFDTTTVTLPQLAEVVGTLVDYLKTLGPLAA